MGGFQRSSRCSSDEHFSVDGTRCLQGPVHPMTCWSGRRAGDRRPPQAIRSWRGLWHSKPAQEAGPKGDFPQHQGSAQAPGVRSSVDPDACCARKSNAHHPRQPMLQGATCSWNATACPGIVTGRVTQARATGERDAARATWRLNHQHGATHDTE